MGDWEYNMSKEWDNTEMMNSVKSLRGAVKRPVICRGVRVDRKGCNPIRQILSVCLRTLFVPFSGLEVTIHGNT